MNTSVEVWADTYFGAVQPPLSEKACTTLSKWAVDVGHRYALPAGAQAFRQGSRAGSALMLRSGQAILRRGEHNGLEVAVGLCGPGTFLGLHSVLAGEPHAVSAFIRFDSEVAAVPAERIVEALSAGSIRAALVGQLVAEHLGLVRRYTARAALSVRDRVLILLEEEARRMGRLPGPISMSPADVAALIGADPSHLYRVLRDLRASRVIDFSRGRITVREEFRRVSATRLT